MMMVMMVKPLGMEVHSLQNIIIPIKLESQVLSKISNILLQLGILR